MKALRNSLVLVAAVLASTALQGCNDDATGPTEPSMAKGGTPGGGGGGRPGGEPEAGNNLSFPVIWSEGVAKVLPGTPGMVPVLNGEYWYQWGTNGSDPDITPASCPADPDEGSLDLNPAGLPLCDDGIPLSVDLALVAGSPPADTPMELVRAYLQKDPANQWQAFSGSASEAGLVPNLFGGVDVDWIDWGDNLESVDWYTRSQVRTEVVLFQDLATPQLEYEMRHTSGWGIDEVHGMATDLAGVPLLGPGDQATVYTNCARLTIQKLAVDRNDPNLAYLEWVPGEGWTEPEFYPDGETPFDLDLINEHIFNGSVHEGGDGPGYYSAEINVKGRIIFGYTWNVRRLNDMSDGTAAGDYRITFSLDDVCGTTSLATYFVEGTTEIVLPLEEEIEAAVAAEAEEGDDGGAVGVLDFLNNLSYMDVRILERGGGGGGGGGNPNR